jgi:hypothetical protein
MKDNLAKFKVTFINAVTGEQREQTYPVLGTTKIDELLPYSPANRVLVAVQTLLGTSEPLTLTVGTEEVSAPAFGSVRSTEARAITLLWDKAGLSDTNLIRIEVYENGSLQQATYAPAASGSTVIDALSPETEYDFALFLLDTGRGMHSLRPLIIQGTTAKLPKPGSSSGTGGGGSSSSSSGSTSGTKPSTAPAQPKTSSAGAVKVTAKVTLKKKSTTITCVKGSLRKTVTGTTPKCPAGWKKK